MQSHTKQTQARRVPQQMDLVAGSMTEAGHDHRQDSPASSGAQGAPICAQSSAHQVLHNRESSALQYAMRDRLIALGWSEIEVIDDDLGRSAAGFERMVAQVCLGKVGAVAAREVSRFARNSRDCSS